MSFNPRKDTMDVGPDGRYRTGGDTHILVYQPDYKRMRDDSEYLEKMRDVGMGLDWAMEHGRTVSLDDYIL